MSTLIEEISTITAKGQTTIPSAIRQALGVDDGGRIAFRVDEHGVSVHRAEDQSDDPAIGRFLAFLARDIERRPEAIADLSPTLLKRIAELSESMAVDLDAVIDGDVAI